MVVLIFQHSFRKWQLCSCKLWLISLECGEGFCIATNLSLPSDIPLLLKWRPPASTCPLPSTQNQMCGGFDVDQTFQLRVGQKLTASSHKAATHTIILAFSTIVVRRYEKCDLFNFLPHFNHSCSATGWKCLLWCGWLSAPSFLGELEPLEALNSDVLKLQALFHKLDNHSLRVCFRLSIYLSQVRQYSEH